MSRLPRPRGTMTRFDAHRAGQRFGHWTLRTFASYQCGQLLYTCVCDCGTVQDVHWTSLRRGRTSACEGQWCPYSKYARRRIQLTHNGRTQTLQAWAAEVGMMAHTLHGRLRHGTPLAQALDPRDLHGMPLEAFGRAQTITQWAAEVNMKRITLYKRVYKGMPLEHALTLPVRAHKDYVRR